MSRMQLVIAVVQVKINGLVREAKKVNLASWGMMAGFFLIPVLAPQYDLRDVISNFINNATLILALLMLVVGGYKFIKEPSWWAGVLAVIGLLFGGGLLVSGALNLFDGNSLGNALYDLIVESLQ